MWFLMDNRFQTEPLTNNSSFLVTNAIDFDLSNLATTSNHYARFTTSAAPTCTAGPVTTSTINFVNTLAWMHLIFHNYDTTASRTWFFNVNHNMFAFTPLAVAPFTANTISNPRGAGSCPLTNLYLCGNPDATIPRCAGRYWVDAYYKNLRIWDGNFASVWSVIKQDQL